MDVGAFIVSNHRREICFEQQFDIDTEPKRRAEGGVHRRPESTYAQKQHPVVNVKFSWASWWRPEMDTTRSNM